MLTWKNSSFSIDASVRVCLRDRDVPSYFQNLEHLLRSCARPAFALERLSLHTGSDGSDERIRYTVHRHKRGTWVSPGRKRKATAPGENVVVDLPPGEGRDEGARNHAPPRSHDTSRIGWAKLLAKIAEDFPLACPACGGDIRLSAFIIDPAPIRKILTHLGEPLEPPPLAPARRPPTRWDDLVQVHVDRDAIQASHDDLPVIDIRSL